MFQGSAHVPSGQHIGLLQAAGASVNATTWFDRTNYFETLPTGGLDLALWLEADRLGTLLDALTQESLDNQREVVKEERRQRYDNVPYGDAMELLNALTFPADHPYGHTTIGSMDDLNAATLADVQALLPDPLPAQQRGARPSSATSTRTTPSTRAATYFGPLAAGAKPAKPVAEPLGPLTGHRARRDRPAWCRPRRSTCPGGCRPAAPGSSTPSTWPSACSATARPRGCTSSWSAAPSTPRRAGASTHGADRRQLVRVRVRPGPGRRLARAAGGRPGRRGRPARAPNGPTEQELRRAKAQYERHWLHELARVDSRADALGEYATLHGDPDLINSRIAEIDAVTVDDIADARRALVPRRAAGHPDLPEGPRPMTDFLPQPELAPPGVWSFPTPTRARLDNGIETVVFQLPGQHVVVGPPGAGHPAERRGPRPRGRGHDLRPGAGRGHPTARRRGVRRAAGDRGRRLRHRASRWPGCRRSSTSRSSHLEPALELFAEAVTRAGAGRARTSTGTSSCGWPRSSRPRPTRPRRRASPSGRRSSTRRAGPPG